MQTYLQEVDANFELFFQSVPKNIDEALINLSESMPLFQESYRRLVSLQAWRAELLEAMVSEGAGGFFKEAQNDALMSHSLARQGAWRVALMSLRSCIENVLFGIYYADHPIEFLQWQNGTHRQGFSELATYLVKHPSFVGLTEQQSGIDALKSEYSTLSKAVHGSSATFRMTKNGTIQGLNFHSVAELGAWLTRERHTLVAVNTILLTTFRQNLQGASYSNLRKAVSLSIPEVKHEQIKQLLGVKLRAVPAA